MNIQTTMILKLVACINVFILDGREEVNHTITGYLRLSNSSRRLSDLFWSVPVFVFRFCGCRRVTILRYEKFEVL